MAVARVKIDSMVMAGTPLSAVSGATVTVNNRGGGAALVYSNSGASNTTLTQPLVSDTSGKLPGWLAPGSYDLSVTYSGVTYTESIEAFPGSLFSTVVFTDDARLSDQRVPTDGSVNATKVASSLKPSGSATTTTEALRALGTSAGQALPGNDSSVTNARTPTGHHGTHEPGGTDAMAVDAAAGTGSLRTIGTGALQAAAGNDSRFGNPSPPSGAAGGDLSGNYPDPTVNKLLNLLSGSALEVMRSGPIHVGTAYDGLNGWVGAYYSCNIRWDGNNWINEQFNGNNGWWAICLSGAGGSLEFMSEQGTGAATRTYTPAQFRAKIVASIGPTGVVNAIGALQSNGVVTLLSSALSNANPIIAGTASAGTSSNVARADHVHPSDAPKTLAYQEIVQAQTGITTGDVTNLSITFTAGSRNVMLEAWASDVIQQTVAGYITSSITDSVNTQVTRNLNGSLAAGTQIGPIYMKKRLTGLTPGNSYTYKVRLSTTAGTVDIHALPAFPAYIRAYEV